MYNNLPLIMHLTSSSVPPGKAQHLSTREKLPEQPVLINRLRSEASIRFEADVLAPDALWRQQTRQSAHSISQSTTSDDSTGREGLKDVLQSQEGPSNPFAKIAQWAAARKVAHQIRVPPVWESHHVLSAIDRKDAETLMRIRDSAFELLLHDTGLRETPLKYAMRVQPEMAIVLLGAFSRYINNLDDEILSQERTHATLLSLRAELQSAIRHGLATSQNDLIASFLQALAMSEGDKWVTENVNIVKRALKAGPAGRPVHTAQSIMRKFASSALKDARHISSVEDYLANAAGDLLMMAAWAAVCKTLNAPRLPISFFARDDRIYRVFVDQLNVHLGEIELSIPLKLRKRLEILREGMQGRRLSDKQKLELLAKQLDEPRRGRIS